MVASKGEVIVDYMSRQGLLCRGIRDRVARRLLPFRCATPQDAAQRRRLERTPAASGVLDLHPIAGARARKP